MRYKNTLLDSDEWRHSIDLQKPLYLQQVTKWKEFRHGTWLASSGLITQKTAKCSGKVAQKRQKHSLYQR